MTGQRLISSIGDPTEFLRRNELFKKSCDFLDEHFSELLQKYPNQWVGIFAGEVWAHASDLNEMLGKLDALGVSRAATHAEFLATNPRIEVL